MEEFMKPWLQFMMRFLRINSFIFSPINQNLKQTNCGLSSRLKYKKWREQKQTIRIRGFSSGEAVTEGD